VLPPVCILAGGLGTRLGQRVRDTPKPLIEIAGEPFLQHQLRLLAQHGAHEVVLCVGYLGERIQESIGTERFALSIAYSHDGPKPLGTLGAIRKALPLLGERFLVLYGDTYLRIDYARVAAAWQRSGLPALMTVFRNDGRLEPSNAVLDGELITAYDKRRSTPDMRWIDYGLGGLVADVLETVPASLSDLADLYHGLASRQQLFGFLATNRFYDIGTPEALAGTSAFLRRLRGSATAADPTPPGRSAEPEAPPGGATTQAGKRQG
jgi:NDP-sugar pyrophosphorylase family protein